MLVSLGVGGLLTLAFRPKRAAAAPLALPPAPSTSHRTHPAAASTPPSLDPKSSYAPSVLTVPAASRSALATSLRGMSEADYLRAVEGAFLRGSVPPSQSIWHPVTVQSGAMTGTFFVQGLPLCLGDDAAMFHPAIPATMAQRIADRMGASLPTRKMVDAIHEQASGHIAFRAFASDRSAVPTFVDSSDGIEARRLGRTGLLSDLGKDYVLSNQRRSNPRRITIYGAWSSPTAAPTQPLATPHALTYYDYSQHARMVRGTVLVNGREMALSAALTDPTIAPLFSSEGALSHDMLRYPTA